MDPSRPACAWPGVFAKTQDVDRNRHPSCRAGKLRELEGEGERPAITEVT
jgi:hypothetical protein